MIKLVFILLCSSLLCVNTIELKVLNSANEPINSVYVINLDTDEQYITNTQGVFNIECVESADMNLALSHIGYIEKNIIFNCYSNEYVVFLNDRVIDFDGLIVTGLRKESYIKNTPVLTRIISSQEIQNSSYSSVKEVLEISLPNVQNVISSHAGISNENIKVQGLDNKYLLFLVDGKRISGEFAGNLDFRMLDISNIDRIEIVEGGMSSLYGSSAIGGVVNIITMKNDKSFDLRYSYLYDDPMIVVNSMDLSANYRDFFYSINVTNQDSDGYDLTPTESIYQIKTLEQYNTRSIKHSLEYNKNNFHLSLAHKNYKNNIYLYQQQTLMILDQEDPNYPSYNYISYRNWIPRFDDISYSFDLKYNNKKSVLRLSYNEEEYIKSNYFFNYDEQDCDQIDCSDLTNLNSAEFVNGLVRNQSSLIQYDFDGRRKLFTVGLEYNNDSYSSFNIYHYGYMNQNGNFDLGDYNDNGQCDMFVNDCLVESIFDSQDATKYFKKLSFFIGSQFNFLNDNRLGLSCRYVNSENFRDNYVYSFAYMVKNFNPYDLRFNYSKGYRTPAIKELYYSWYGHDPAIIGNPDLLPTTNNYVSASIEKRDLNYNFSFEFFYNDVNEMIGINYSEDSDGVSIAQYNNYQNILFYGLNSHIEFKDDVNTFKFIYNFTNPNSENIEALELISKNSIRFNWLRNIIEDRLNVAMNIKYSSEKFIVLNSEKIMLDDYIFLDIVGIININSILNMKVGFKNVLDYKDDRRFLDNGSDFLTTYDPGRRLFFQLDFNLN